jgi:hypothetical protein
MRKRMWIATMIAAALASFGSSAETATAAPEVSLTVMNPRGEIAPPPLLAPQPRIPDLSGKKLAIYWNGKAGGNHFWKAVEQLLKEKLPNTNVLRYDGAYDLGDPLAARIAKEADAFLYGVGD